MVVITARELNNWCSFQLLESRAKLRASKLHGTICQNSQRGTRSEVLLFVSFSVLRLTWPVIISSSHSISSISCVSVHLTIQRVYYIFQIYDESLYPPLTQQRQQSSINYQQLSIIQIDFQNSNFSILGYGWKGNWWWIQRLMHFIFADGWLLIPFKSFLFLSSFCWRELLQRSHQNSDGRIRSAWSLRASSSLRWLSYATETSN